MRLEDPVKILRRNIKTMMAAHGIPSGNQLAKASGVSQKAVSNLLSDEWAGTPTLETVERVAITFGLAAWQLMAPKLTTDTAINIALRNGYEREAAAMAAAYMEMPPQVRAEVLSIVGYVMDKNPVLRDSRVNLALKECKNCAT